MKFSTECAGCKPISVPKSYNFHKISIELLIGMGCSLIRMRCFIGDTLLNYGLICSACHLVLINKYNFDNIVIRF